MQHRRVRSEKLKLRGGGRRPALNPTVILPEGTPRL